MSLINNTLSRSNASLSTSEDVSTYDATGLQQGFKNKRGNGHNNIANMGNRIATVLDPIPATEAPSTPKTAAALNVASACFSPATNKKLTENIGIAVKGIMENLGDKYTNTSQPSEQGQGTSAAASESSSLSGAAVESGTAAESARTAPVGGLALHGLANGAAPSPVNHHGGDEESSDSGASDKEDEDPSMSDLEAAPPLPSSFSVSPTSKKGGNNGEAVGNSVVVTVEEPLESEGTDSADNSASFRDKAGTPLSSPVAGQADGTPSLDGPALSAHEVLHQDVTSTLTELPLAKVSSPLMPEEVGVNTPALDVDAAAATVADHAQPLGAPPSPTSSSTPPASPKASAHSASIENAETSSTVAVSPAKAESVIAAKAYLSRKEAGGWFAKWSLNWLIGSAKASEAGKTFSARVQNWVARVFDTFSWGLTTKRAADILNVDATDVVRLLNRRAVK